MNRVVFHGPSWAVGYFMANAQAGLLGWEWVWLSVLCLLFSAAWRLNGEGK